MSDNKNEEINLDEDINKLKEKAEALIQQEVNKQNNPFINLPTPKNQLSLDPEEIAQEKEKHITQDILLETIRQGANSFSILDKILEEIAEESASLKFERKLQEKQLIDTTKTSKARALILKQVADILVTKRELAKRDVINLRSKRMQAVFKFLVTIVKSSIDEIQEINPELKELFFNRLQKNLDGFEDKAEQLLAQIEEN